jgi:hypothetical protein
MASTHQATPNKCRQSGRVVTINEKVFLVVGRIDAGLYTSAGPGRNRYP